MYFGCLDLNFGLGAAPKSWHFLTEALQKHGHSLEKAHKVGLIVRQPQKGGFYDRFRNRLVCPIIGLNDQVVGFSARALSDEEKGAKYINSPESPIYKKSKLLFGINRARNNFRIKGHALLVEGNFDVVSLHQWGFGETVAPLGTALTNQQAEKLRRLTEKVILMYDGDKAGHAATIKGLKTLLAADLEVYIAQIPEGSDPDSVIQNQGPEALGEIIKRAQPGIEYFIFEEWAHRANSADGKSRALQEAAQVMSFVKSRTKKDLVAGTLASALQVELGTVRRAFAGEASVIKKKRSEPNSRFRAPNEPADSPDRRDPARQKGPPPPSEEVELLAILADHPELMKIAEEIDVFSLLTDELLRDMYCRARSAGSIVNTVTGNEFSIPSEIAKRILRGAYVKVTDPTRCLQEAAMRIRESRGRKLLADLQKQAKVAKRRGDTELERKLVHEILKMRRQV